MTEQEANRKRLREEMEARKRKASTPDGGAGTVEVHEEPLVPKTFREKWNNYWYHYKGGTILAVVVAAILIPFLVQMFTPEHFDATLVLATEIPIDAVADPMQEALTPFVQDNDGNGTPELKIIVVQLDVDQKYSGEAQMIEASIAKMAGMLSQHENFLLIVDTTAYKMIKKLGAVFADLTQWTDLPCTEGGGLYHINPTELGKILQMDDAKTDFYLALLDVNSLPEKLRNDKKVTTAYERDYQLLRSLLDVK